MVKPPNVMRLTASLFPAPYHAALVHSHALSSATPPEELHHTTFKRTVGYP